MIAANSMPMSSAMYSSDHSLPYAMTPTASLGLASQSESHSLFAQLRNLYPAGALVSELVQVHDGQFVVRVLVQVGTTTLATAMAAATQVEEAEDRARVRAMAVLGISPAIAMSVPPVMPSTSDAQPQRAAEPLEEAHSLDSIALPESVLPAIDEKILGPVDAKKTSRRKKEKQESPSEPDLLSFPGLEDADFKGAEVPSSPEPVEREYFGEPDSGEVSYNEVGYDSGEIDYTEEPAQAAFVANEPLKAIVPDVSTDPIDLSDAIAQIGTEIERIGWTKKQGSTYLQQTYSKKTRAELTEDELLEFLHYLKALPSKGHPSLSQLPF